MSNQNLQYTLSLKDLFTSKMAGAIKQTSKLDRGISRLQTGIAAAVTVGGIASFGRQIIESLKNYEYFSAALRTLLMGDAAAARALEADLIKLAEKTPFNLTELQDASKQLLAYGFSASSVTKNISMLGDVAAGLKIPFGDIAYLYGTLKTQGRAYSKDINQFTGRGIPIIKQLAKQFKVADSQMMKLVEDGKVGFKDIEKAFQSMTSEGGQFFDMMDAQSQTVGGRISNMGDQWEQLKVKIGQSSTGIIASILGIGSALLTSLNRGVDAMNLLDKAFEKSGQNFNFWEKYIVAFLSKTGQLFGMEAVKGGYADMQGYADRMKEAFVNSSGSIKDVNSDISLLVETMGRLRDDKSMDSREKLMKMGVISTIIDMNKDRLALLRSPTDKAGATPLEGAADPKLGVGAASSGTRPQNLYINIEKLVENLNLKAQTIKEGAGRIKEEVSKALLEAVNDVNYITR